MKAVMMSIQPKWCELIANGKKTIEVRKTHPKLEAPLKVYIYCTNSKDMLWILRKNERNSEKIASIFTAKDVGGATKANGKVIGEFMCYDIGKYETEFYPPEKQPVYEAITEWNKENEVYESVASNCDTYSTNFLKATCMSFEDFREYLGVGEIPFYGWHISDLVIYDEPKELSEFHLPCTNECDGYCECGCVRLLKRPPQSWCYVEELV